MDRTTNPTASPLTRPRTLALVGAVVCPSILLAATLGIAADHYWLPRYKSGAVPIAHQGDTGWEDFGPLLSTIYYPCSDQAIWDIESKRLGKYARCRQSMPGPHIDVALVGDSHVEHLFQAFAAALPDKNIVYYFWDGLPLKSISGMDLIIEHVTTDPAIKTVIVNASWYQRGVAGAELVKTLEAFRSKGKAVFVTDDIPQFGFDAVACKYRKAPILPFAQCSEDRKVFAAAYATYYPELKAAVDKVPGVQLLHTAHYFCDNDVCSMNKGTALLYREARHLNRTGGSYLVNRMLTDFPQLRAALTQP